MLIILFSLPLLMQLAKIVITYRSNNSVRNTKYVT